MIIFEFPTMANLHVLKVAVLGLDDLDAYVQAWSHILKFNPILPCVMNG
jgi:hypothetical protein